MQWEEFVYQWANQKIEIPDLLLSKPLTTDEVEAVLAVIPQLGYRGNIINAAKSIHVSKRTMDKRWEGIYIKCNLSEGTSRYVLIGNRLASFFDANYYAAVASTESSNIHLSPSENSLEFPEGVVPIGSKFYMEPSSVLKQCQEAIAQTKALLRIQAPRQRGKTSLLERIIHHAKSLNYRIARVDFRHADRATLEDLDSLLQWLCRQICKQLNLQIVVSECWDEEDDSKGACTNFFEEYFLQPNALPLLLSLDNLEEIFTNPLVGEDICTLLRAWHQEESRAWQNIRTIILHTWYVIDDIKPSPLDNVGILINLPELNHDQVNELVRLYDLALEEHQIKALTDLVGFHPFLIRFALDRIASGLSSLEDVLERGYLPDGIFQQHLDKHMRYLERKPELFEIAEKILKQEYPLKARSSLLMQLRDSGFIKADGSRYIFANKLYLLYFQMYLG